MSRYSRTLGALIGLAALPLFLACQDDPLGPSGRLEEPETTDVQVVPEWNLIEVGETVQLRALLPGARGDGDVEWETSDPEIALVDAEWEGHRGMARVTVQDPDRMEPEDDDEIK